MNKYLILILMLLAPLSLFGEAIFLKDGSIIKGKVIKQYGNTITIINKNKIKEVFNRKNILRILYNEEYKKTVLIILKNNKEIRAHIVFENQDSYTIRKVLFENIEEVILKKNVNGVLKKDISLRRKEEERERTQKMALSIGGSYTFEFDSGFNSLNNSSFEMGGGLDIFAQYAIAKTVTLEIDLQQIIAGSANQLAVLPMELLVGARWWASNKAYKGIYLGSGIGITIPYKTINTTGIGFDISFKLGYSFLFDAGFFIDLGIRADVYSIGTNANTMFIFITPVMSFSAGYNF